MDEIKEEKIEEENVQVYVLISGAYCAFRETVLKVVYDLTNDHQVGNNEYSKEELDNWDSTEYSDIAEFKAIKKGKEYFVKL